MRHVLWSITPKAGISAILPSTTPYPKSLKASVTVFHFTEAPSAENWTHSKE